jgi:hypothetical protein
MMQMGGLALINTCTEEEAKEKVCPQAIHMLGMQPLINCMGGGCMAWRWADSYFDELEKRIINPEVGYCGLGGKP